MAEVCKNAGHEGKYETHAGLADSIEAAITARAVYQVTGLAGGDWADCDKITYDEAASWRDAANRRRILYTGPGNPADAAAFAKAGL